MIRYCFPHINPNDIEDEAEFAELANDADWIIKNVIHPQSSDPAPQPKQNSNDKIRTM
jgi:hypothetical protein